MFILQNYVEQQLVRFTCFNQARLERARSAMHSQALNVFNLLPALLHVNHPSIPGYLDQPVVHGIEQFSLSAIQADFFTDCAKAFGEHATLPDATQTQPIKGLYSMGSTASLGQSLTSDLDIWVCVQPWVSVDARVLLEQKCTAISRWAMSLGIEVNFFVMYEQRFRSSLAEEMTSDNCGTSQHFLLLDEFYRSAVCLAGQPLLWYVVAPEDEHRYEEVIAHLVNDKILQREDWVDFGGLPFIPAEEYFGSSLWQLYKSIDSPYKSVLKAILLEAYSWEYPETVLLSIECKQRFFANKIDIIHTDAYLLMLGKVTEYLLKINDLPRLDLVRRCFYLKTHEKLSQQPNANEVTWRREVLANAVEEWGWSMEVIAHQDNRRNWKVGEVKAAHDELLAALMKSYRSLIRFARQNEITSAISPEDISILARKLYAAFEVLPGKVTLLNPQLSPDLHEANLTFIHVPEGRSNPAGWYLYKQSPELQKIIGHSPLEHNRYLSKLVAWAYFNGLLTEQTKLHLIAPHSDMQLDKLYQFTRDIRNTFSLSRENATRQALSGPCEIRKLALFVNLEQDPTMAIHLPNRRRDFTLNDIFSYGDKQECLVGSVDLVYINSWNEVRTLHFKGDNAMLDVLQTLLGKMHQDALIPESVDVFCSASQISGTMRNLIFKLVDDCISMRLAPSEQNKHCRFRVLKVANQIFGLFIERRGVSVQKLENPVDFYRSISSNKIGESMVMPLDNAQMQPPSIVDAFASEGLIQLFFEDCLQGYNVYILDENNRVEAYHQCSHMKKEDIVQELNSFYASTQNTLSVHSESVNFNLPQFYHIIQQNGRTQAIPYKSERTCKPSAKQDGAQQDAMLDECAEG